MDYSWANELLQLAQYIKVSTRDSLMFEVFSLFLIAKFFLIYSAMLGVLIIALAYARPTGKA